MKSIYTRIMLSFALSTLLAGTAIAGPDFAAIERAKLAKKAEQAKGNVSAKKCFDDSAGSQAVGK